MPVKLHFKLTQSGVSENFKMLVPVYLELPMGAPSARRSRMIGNSAEKTVQMAKPPVPIKRVMIDYMHDVLAIEN
jgi:hypothetical protein